MLCGFMKWKRPERVSTIANFSGEGMFEKGISSTKVSCLKICLVELLVSIVELCFGIWKLLNINLLVMEIILWVVLGVVNLFLLLACISRVVLSIEEITLFKKMMVWICMIMVIAIIVGNYFFEIPRDTSFWMMSLVCVGIILQKKAQDNLYSQLFFFLADNPVGFFMPESEDEEEEVFYGSININGKTMSAVGVDSEYKLGQEEVSFVYVELDEQGDFRELQVVIYPQEVAEGSV